MFQPTPFEDVMPAQTLSRQLSHIKTEAQITFSLTPEAWPITRAWIIAPERLPYYPKFLKAVDQHFKELSSQQSEILSFYQSFPYHNRSFWLKLSQSSSDQQLEHLLNCCALSVMVEHIKDSEIQQSLCLIQNYINCYVLDTPSDFKELINLAVQLKDNLMPVQSLANYLDEFDTASNLPEIEHPNILVNVLQNIQQRYQTRSSDADSLSWTQRILDTADQISDSVFDLFKNVIPIPISAAFTTHQSSSSALLWADNGSELSMIQTEGSTFLKWSGPRPLEHLIQNNSPLTCTKSHTFNASTVQYWGPVHHAFQQIQFYDGLDAYQIIVSDAQDD